MNLVSYDDEHEIPREIDKEHDNFISCKKIKYMTNTHFNFTKRVRTENIKKFPKINTT